jgi:gluconolactonase
VVAETGGGPNGAAIGPDGAVYVTNNGGGGRCGSIQRVDIGSGAVETVYEACEGRPLLRPNDLVFDRHGGMWFTDFGTDVLETRHYGALYYALADGSMISRQRSRIVSPNGVGLSPDQTVVYVAETYNGRLWAHDIVEPGVLAAPKSRFEPGRVVANLQTCDYLDSLAVEASGKVCVATILNGGITVFDPEDGSTRHVPVPSQVTTNICFGGADMRDAWITGSDTGKLFRCRWPRPGLELNFNA